MRRTSWAGVRRVAFFRWKNIIGGDEEGHGGSCDVEDYVNEIEYPVVAFMAMLIVTCFLYING